jgi:hypothetical protein
MAVFNLIQHTELSGTASSFDKTSIPSTYDHLYFVASAKTDQVSWVDACELTFNGVTGTSYGTTSIYGWANPPVAADVTSYSSIKYIYVNAAEASSDDFATIEIWIPNYANTSNNTQILAQWGWVGNDDTDNRWITGQTSGVFMNTAAIDQFTLSAGGNNFVAHSTFTLYGINGAV